ncbi:UNVERIFIED_ORG: serine phosphatase RsbU (regulator of sigma subunit) [Herbaspirillum seropedicae]
MLPRPLRRLWLSWSLLMLAALMALVAGLGWMAHRAAADLAAPELKQSSRLIGRTLVGDLERALAYRIPIARLAGVDAWFNGLARDNPMLDLLVLTDAQGNILARLGGDATVLRELGAASAQTTAAHGMARGSFSYIETLPIKTPDGALAGWLHVGSKAPPLPLYGWWWSLSAAVVLAALATLSLLQLVRWRLQSPLALSHQCTLALAGGKLSHLSDVPVRDPASQYQAALAGYLHTLRRRNDALLLKLEEVRAAHFNPAIVETLDNLARPLLARRPPSHQEAAQSTARGANAQHRALLVTLMCVLTLLTCAYGLHRQYQQADQRRLLESGSQLLLQSWQAVLDEDRNQLDQDLAPLLTAEAGQRLLRDKSPDDVLETVIRHSTRPGLALAVLELDGSLHAAAGQSREATTIPVLTLPLLRGATDGLYGIWQNGVRDYQSGAVRRIEVEGHALLLVATRPLEKSLGRLRERLLATRLAAGDDGASSLQVAVADLRGQPVLDAYASLTSLWRAHDRSNFMRDGNQAAVLVSLALNAPSGHALGTLLAMLPQAPRLEPDEDLAILLWAALAASALLALLLYVRSPFVLLGQATRQLERLADGDTDVQAPLQGVRQVRLWHGMMQRIAGKIDALETLRRSRERQGKRQARFIRRQMMQLAERLDEAARRGILEDLHRIEHGRRPDATSDSGTDERAGRIADEFGVLALGFQNLVSRVGEQYQELDRLVNQLREALQAKTQFIALQQELEIASKMQLSILPRQFAANPALSLHAMMIPAKEVGGDFYDFFDLDAHRTALVIADVSGKGVPAAFFMAVSRTLLRAIAPYTSSAAACIARVNDLLAADNEEMMFVTLFYAILDTRDGSMHYINAGHNPPYLLRADGCAGHPPATRGIALAVETDMYFEQGTVQLAPGDGLFLYTDGITEATDPDQQLFGEQRLIEELKQATGRPVGQITRHVVERIKDFEAGGPQADDITCMMVRYRGGA